MTVATNICVDIWCRQLWLASGRSIHIVAAAELLQDLGIKWVSHNFKCIQPSSCCSPELQSCAYICASRFTAISHSSFLSFQLIFKGTNRSVPENLELACLCDLLIRIVLTCSQQTVLINYSWYSLYYKDTQVHPSASRKVTIFCTYLDKRVLGASYKVNLSTLFHPLLVPCTS